MPEMTFLRNAVLAYWSSTMAYGFTRAVTYDYQGSKKYYNRKTARFEVKEMLLIDNVGRVSFNTIAAVSAWPFMLSEDLTRLECAIKGKDPSEYE